MKGHYLALRLFLNNTQIVSSLHFHPYTNLDHSECRLFYFYSIRISEDVECLMMLISVGMLFSLALHCVHVNNECRDGRKCRKPSRQLWGRQVLISCHVQVIEDSVSCHAYTGCIYSVRKNIVQPAQFKYVWCIAYAPCTWQFCTGICHKLVR